jgi:hypothetical protein
MRALLASCLFAGGFCLGQAITSPPGQQPPNSSVVISFANRSGAVTPMANDYTFSMIGGQIGSNQLPSLSAMIGLLNLSQLNASGFTAGSVIGWNGSAFVPMTLSQIGGQINLTQIASGGAATGNVLTFGTSTWGPGSGLSGGSGGAVTSVFGRTGSVIAASGDYSYSQISGTPVFVDQITPTGAINGTNNVFTIPGVPAAGTLYVWRNGILQANGAPPGDYTLSGTTIQFNSGSIPQPGDKLLVSYRQ